MPIIITNLLVGLAVDDIQSVQENAVLQRLAMQVLFTSFWTLGADLHSKKCRIFILQNLYLVASFITCWWMINVIQKIWQIMLPSFIWLRCGAPTNYVRQKFDISSYSEVASFVFKTYKVSGLLKGTTAFWKEPQHFKRYHSILKGTTVF